MLVIADDIITASGEPRGLKDLAEFYTTGLLLPMKAGGQTPQVSFHPSRDQEIQSEANEIAVDLEIAKRDPSKLKKYALQRDGYRCVVTRTWNLPSVELPDLQKGFNPETDGAAMTEAAHILPFSLVSADTQERYLFKKCTIWSVIKSFTNIEFKELNGENINSLTNVITFDSAVHKLFGPLHIWFEAVPGVPNTYKIRKARDYYLRDVVENGALVTLSSPNPNLLLPDPRYLIFHAAVAKVVHMAGMAEFLDDKLRKYEDIRVLSDESGAEYLDGLLRIAQRRIATY